MAITVTRMDKVGMGEDRKKQYRRGGREREGGEEEVTTTTKVIIAVIIIIVKRILMRVKQKTIQIIQISITIKRSKHKDKGK